MEVIEVNNINIAYRMFLSVIALVWSVFCEGRMDKKYKEILEKNFLEVASFRHALNGESDRGCALFASSYLDASLAALLRSHLVKNDGIDNDLFVGMSPLSSFSSRIKMAFYLGLISKTVRCDLDTIRKIRNDFAHDASAISFETRSIHDRCNNLVFSHHDAANPLRHFTSAALGILGVIHVATYTTERRLERSDDASSEKVTDMINDQLYELAVKLSESKVSLEAQNLTEEEIRKEVDKMALDVALDVTRKHGLNTKGGA